MGLLGVHVHWHAIGGGSLAAMAGDSLAVVEMGMFVDIEMRVPQVDDDPEPGVESITRGRTEQERSVPWIDGTS